MAEPQAGRHQAQFVRRDPGQVVDRHPVVGVQAPGLGEPAIEGGAGRPQFVGLPVGLVPAGLVPAGLVHDALEGLREVAVDPGTLGFPDLGHAGFGQLPGNPGCRGLGRRLADPPQQQEVLGGEVAVVRKGRMLGYVGQLVGQVDEPLGPIQAAAQADQPQPREIVGEQRGVGVQADDDVAAGGGPQQLGRLGAVAQVADQGRDLSLLPGLRGLGRDRQAGRLGVLDVVPDPPRALRAGRQRALGQGGLRPAVGDGRSSGAGLGDQADEGGAGKQQPGQQQADRCRLPVPRGLPQGAPAGPREGPAGLGLPAFCACRCHLSPARPLLRFSRLDEPGRRLAQNA